MATKKAKKPSKAKKLRTELRIDANGNYIVRDSQDAKLALIKAGELTEKIDEIIVENRLKDKEATLEHLRHALRDYQDENDVPELFADDFRSLLVERTSSMWILNDHDIPENLDDESRAGVKSLIEILQAKWPGNIKKRTNFLRKVTKQVLIPAALNEQVKAGKISADELAPAFLNLVQTTYVKVSRND
jgi:hypothetical protein